MSGPASHLKVVKEGKPLLVGNLAEGVVWVHSASQVWHQACEVVVLRAQHVVYLQLSTSKMLGGQGVPAPKQPTAAGLQVSTAAGACPALQHGCPARPGVPPCSLVSRLRAGDSLPWLVQLQTASA